MWLRSVIVILDGYVLLLLIAPVVAVDSVGGHMFINVHALYCNKNNNCSSKARCPSNTGPNALYIAFSLQTTKYIYRYNDKLKTCT